MPELDNATIGAIEADFMLTVYHARRLARLRLLGLVPAPEPNPRAREMLRRLRRHCRARGDRSACRDKRGHGGRMASPLQRLPDALGHPGVGPNLALGRGGGMDRETETSPDAQADRRPQQP